MEIIEGLIAYLATNPSMAALLTAAGLGTALKLVIVPLVKLVCAKLNLNISGSKTVFAVYVSAMVTVVVVTAITKSPWNLGYLLLLAWQATKDSIGLQETMSAIKRPEKL